jgi:hypothetical protein
MAVRGWPGLNHMLHGELPCDLGKVPGKSRGLEKRRRSKLDGGGPAAAAEARTPAKGGAPLDEHMARGGVVVHREGLRILGARGNRLEHGAHRAAAMADGGSSGRHACARGDGEDRLISAGEGRLG